MEWLDRNSFDILFSMKDHIRSMSSRQLRWKESMTWTGSLIANLEVVYWQERHAVRAIIWTRVSNGTRQYNFLGQRDRSFFLVLGQRDNLKILPRDGTGRDSQNSRRDGPGQPKSGMGRGTKWDRAENDILKQENDVLKQKMMF